MEGIKELFEKCNGSVYQSEEWGDIKKRAGKTPVLLKIEKDGDLKASLLCFENNIKFPVVGNKKILYSEGNPLFLEKEYGLEIIQKFKEESKKYFYGTISPTVIGDFSIFDESGLYRINNHTMILDLQKEEGEILSNLGRDIRRRIKKIKEEGVEIVRSEEESDFIDFYKLYSETMEKGGAAGENEEFFKNLRELSLKDFLSLFVAKKNGKMLSGVVILHNSEYGIYNYSGTSDEGHEIQSNIATLWEAIAYLRRTGRKCLDMGGYDAEAKEGDKTYHINKFKERFGAKVVEQPIYATDKKYISLRKVLKKFRFMKGWYKKGK